jgi:hypothetical protein
MCHQKKCRLRRKRQAFKRRRGICSPTTRGPKPAKRSSGTSRFTASTGRMHRLAAGHRIWSASPRFHRLRQPDVNPAEIFLKANLLLPSVTNPPLVSTAKVAEDPCVKPRRSQSNQDQSPKTSISAMDVHGFPFTSLIALKRTYRPARGAKDTCFSPASFTKPPTAAELPQLTPSALT